MRKRPKAPPDHSEAEERTGSGAGGFQSGLWGSWRRLRRGQSLSLESRRQPLEALNVVCPAWSQTQQVQAIHLESPVKTAGRCKHLSFTIKPVSPRARWVLHFGAWGCWQNWNRRSKQLLKAGNIHGPSPHPGRCAWHGRCHCPPNHNIRSCRRQMDFPMLRKRLRSDLQREARSLMRLAKQLGSLPPFFLGLVPTKGLKDFCPSSL